MNSQLIVTRIINSHTGTAKILLNNNTVEFKLNVPISCRSADKTAQDITIIII